MELWCALGSHKPLRTGFKSRLRHQIQGALNHSQFLISVGEFACSNPQSWIEAEVRFLSEPIQFYGSDRASGNGAVRWLLCPPLNPTVAD